MFFQEAVELCAGVAQGVAPVVVEQVDEAQFAELEFEVAAAGVEEVRFAAGPVDGGVEVVGAHGVEDLIEGYEFGLQGGGDVDGAGFGEEEGGGGELAFADEVHCDGALDEVGLGGEGVVVGGGVGGGGLEGLGGWCQWVNKRGGRGAEGQRGAKGSKGEQRGRRDG